MESSFFLFQKEKTTSNTIQSHKASKQGEFDNKQTYSDANKT